MNKDTKEAALATKERYKIRNWGAYNKSLCKRGSITLWITDEVLETWSRINPDKKEVGKQMYPDSIIQCCLIIGIQFGLKLRQTTGFVSSLLAMTGKGDYAVPDYTTLCRRQGCLAAEVSNRFSRGEKIDIGIDSTGLKVYGEGEWKVRKHGWSKRRTWRKLHIGIDLQTQEIISVSLTGNDKDDAAIAAQMLQGKTDKLKRFKGDGAYDDFKFREQLGTAVEQIIPPPKDAVEHAGTKKKPLPAYLEQRNEAVKFIRSYGSKEWKEQTGYHQRSLNEVAMYRFKTTFGGGMNARKIDNQQTEATLKCMILNKYRELGMPVAYKAA